MVTEYIRPAYQLVRTHARRVDRLLDRRTLTKSEFQDLFPKLGIEPGATVLVHSSMNVLCRRVPGLTPVELVRMLQAALTDSGTLLMPTFPFTGKQVHYIEKTTRFDVRRTPSQVGLATGAFRRMPGVLRSLHPTHPVSAWGQHAKALLDTHHLGGAFGVTSPIYRLREFNGTVVGLGTGIRDSFTIIHVVEEVHPKTHARCFENYTKTMTIVDGDQETLYELQPLRPGVHRQFGRVARVLQREGILRCVNVKGLSCEATHAGDFIDRCMSLVDSDQYL